MLIPAKKVSIIQRNALPVCVFSVNKAWLSGKISTKETNNRTPAANPNEKERKERFERCVKKVSQLPIPVDNPAIRVKENAMMIEDETMYENELMSYKDTSYSQKEKNSLPRAFIFYEAWFPCLNNDYICSLKF